MQLSYIVNNKYRICSINIETIPISSSHWQSVPLRVLSITSQMQSINGSAWRTRTRTGATTWGVSICGWATHWAGADSNPLLPFLFRRSRLTNQLLLRHLNQFWQLSCSRHARLFGSTLFALILSRALLRWCVVYLATPGVAISRVEGRAFYAVLIATSVTAVYAYINFKIAGKRLTPIRFPFSLPSYSTSYP